MYICFRFWANLKECICFTMMWFFFNSVICTQKLYEKERSDHFSHTHTFISGSKLHSVDTLERFFNFLNTFSRVRKKIIEKLHKNNKDAILSKLLLILLFLRYFGTNCYRNLEYLPKYVSLYYIKAKKMYFNFWLFIGFVVFNL